MFSVAAGGVNRQHRYLSDHIADLERRQNALEDEVAKASLHCSTDDLMVVDLKRRILHLRDELEKLKGCEQKPALKLINGASRTIQGCSLEGLNRLAIGNGIAMTEENKNPNNRVDAATNGKFHAFWNGRVVFENGRVKRFETEREAWEFLARCDKADKIIH